MADLNLNRSNNLRPFFNSFRRRSTHTYQSIVLEPSSQQSNEDYDGHFTKQENAQTIQTADVQSQWKIYILTTSVTNYFCCGINMRLTNCTQWMKSNFKSPLTLMKRWLGGEKGEEVGGIKLRLALLVLDWFLDIGTAAYYFTDNNKWIEATLTYLIVIGSGLIITVGFLLYPDIRSYTTTKAKGIGTCWLILLYVPTLFQFVIARLWLDATIDLEMAMITDDEQLKIKLIEERDKTKDFSLKAFWSETVLESKPQALLQTLFLLERTEGFNRLLDFLPLVLSIWSMYSITNSIYELVVSNFKDETKTYSKLYGNTYTVLSILAPVMIVNIPRDSLDSDLNLFFYTLVALVGYYLVFELIYQLTYLVSNRVYYGQTAPNFRAELTFKEESDINESRRHSQFAKFYQIVVLAVFGGCLVSWVFMSQMAESDMTKRIIIVSVFSLCLIVNAITFAKAKAFTVEVFRLKNIKIDNFWKGVPNCIG